LQHLKSKKNIVKEVFGRLTSQKAVFGVGEILNLRKQT
jgi:hypothetical protein